MGVRRNRGGVTPIEFLLNNREIRGDAEAVPLWPLYASGVHKLNISSRDSKCLPSQP